VHSSNNLTRTTSQDIADATIESGLLSKLFSFINATCEEKLEPQEKEQYIAKAITLINNLDAIVQAYKQVDIVIDKINILNHTLENAIVYARSATLVECYIKHGAMYSTDLLINFIKIVPSCAEQEANDILNLLMKLDIPIEEINTAFLYAFKNNYQQNHPTLFQQLENRANPLSKETITQEFISAARAGNEAALMMFLEKGADINAFDAAGRSALFYACWHRMIPSIKAILAKQPDPITFKKPTVLYLSVNKYCLSPKSSWDYAQYNFTLTDIIPAHASYELLELFSSYIEWDISYLKFIIANYKENLERRSHIGTYLPHFISPSKEEFLKIIEKLEQMYDQAKKNEEIAKKIKKSKSNNQAENKEDKLDTNLSIFHAPISKHKNKIQHILDLDKNQYRIESLEEINKILRHPFEQYCNKTLLADLLSWMIRCDSQVVDNNGQLVCPNTQKLIEKLHNELWLNVLFTLNSEHLLPIHVAINHNHLPIIKLLLNTMPFTQLHFNGNKYVEFEKNTLVHSKNQVISQYLQEKSRYADLIDYINYYNYRMQGPSNQRLEDRTVIFYNVLRNFEKLYNNNNYTAQSLIQVIEAGIKQTQAISLPFFKTKLEPETNAEILRGLLTFIGNPEDTHTAMTNIKTLFSGYVNYITHTQFSSLLPFSNQG
jgi:ankyrin repeat protein